jgi:hypothetical protein
MPESSRRDRDTRPVPRYSPRWASSFGDTDSSQQLGAAGGDVIDSTTDGDPEEFGLLGDYGVLVVPAPSERAGGWFVTLAAWDDDVERYIAGSDGPIFDSREEALQVASNLMDWVASRPEDENLLVGWAQMQANRW